jgi:hypothetical protein
MPRNRYQVLCIKYFVSIALIFAVSYLLHTTNYILHAASPLETAQSDYNFEYSKFRDAQDKYTNSKQSYISFKTAAAKDQAYVDSKAYLNQTINLYLSYLSLVNEYVNGVQWQNDQTHQQILNSLQNLKSTYLQQEQLINVSQTLEDLQGNAAALSQKQQVEMNPAIYWIIANLELARTQQLQQEFETLSAKLVQNTKAFPNSTSLSNWQSEIQKISKNSQEQIHAAEKQMERITPDRASEGDAQSVANTLSLSREELKTAKPFFTQAAK